MALPETILDQIRSVNMSTAPRQTKVNTMDRYASLDHFPHSEKFQVVPQLRGYTNPNDTGFTIIIVVMKQKVPEFFAEIKPHVPPKLWKAG